MGIRIDEFVKQRLLELPIENVAERLGIRVKRHTALCFMHDDHHPSLAFFPSRNRWKCFVCDVYGDNISLVMKYNNQSFVDACLWLADNFGIHIEGADEQPKRSFTPRPLQVFPKKVENKITPDFEILQAIVDHFSLTDTARKFLFEERGYQQDMVEQLRICAVDNDAELLAFLLEKFGEERLLKCQLAYKFGSKVRSYFHAPCLFFPYFDTEGKIIGLQARYLGEEMQHQRFQFPKGSSTHIFNQPVIATLAPTEPLFISEGVTDTLALLSAGYKAVAIPSATLLKPSELQLVANRTLLMYPDNDVPGEKLFTQIREALVPLGGTVTRLSLPRDCKDFSEFYRKSLKS